jgi:tetratricopeptide (TPR) repeat protein
MKKHICGMIVLMALFSTAFADEDAPVIAQVKGQYYEVFSDGGGVDAALLLRELETRFTVYNRVFHFNPHSIAERPLKVRVYKDKKAYDDYVFSRLKEARAGAVYLHYNQPEKRELIINRGSPEEAVMFPHQAFIQYLRAFIPYPPSWLREGFAIYFSTLKFDPNSVAAAGPATALAGGLQIQGLVYEENLAWLETVKKLGTNAPPLETILLADVNDKPRNFQAVSWSLASFFLNSGKDDYWRILIETFMLLSPGSSAIGNSQAVLDHIRDWVNMDTLERDYKAYLAGRKTFGEFIADGQAAYALKKFDVAEAAFVNASKLKPVHFAPYYYLGLIAYDEKDYNKAETHYLAAFKYGADIALICYARGVNAIALGRNADAIGFLEQAKSISPADYGERVDDLLRRLR